MKNKIYKTLTIRGLEEDSSMIASLVEEFKGSTLPGKNAHRKSACKALIKAGYAYIAIKGEQHLLKEKASSVIQAVEELKRAIDEIS